MDGNIDRAPTMNIHKSQTTLTRIDPLKKVFRGVFEILPAGARGHVVGFVGEFVGTLFFIFMAFAGAETANASMNKKQDVGVSTKPPGHSPDELLYIAVSVSCSLLVTAWTCFRISGGLFNPAISLGMALIGAITWARCIVISVAQVVATICASYMVKTLFNGGLNVATGLGGDTSNAQAVIIEMLLTCQLAFTIFMLAVEQHAGTFLAPIGIAASLLITELVGVFWTGGSVNPARSLAPCIVNRSFDSNHWIYWVGPTAGVVLAVILYKLVKALEYETTNGEDPTGKPRKPSSVLPLTSIHSRNSNRGIENTRNQADEVQKPKDEEMKAAPPPAAKKEVAVLPECYAD